MALAGGGSLLLLGILVSWRFRLPVTAADDLAPSLHWPAPVLDEALDRERGPLMVTLEYDIPVENATAFSEAMLAVRAMRRRNGALSWGLLQDSENPQLWQEFFFDASWLEHLRHHGRVTVAEQRIEQNARQYQRDGVAVKIRHLLGAAP